MVDLAQTRSAPKEQLFDQIEKVSAGMLGVQGSDMHMQPMSPHLDRETGHIHFFTSNDTDLVKAIGAGARAHFCIVGKNHDYHACLAGTLTQNRSDAIIDRFWSPGVAAWFPEGRSDPKLTVITLSVQSAGVWASTDSTLLFGWEMAKALTTSSTPDVGVRTDVTF